MSRPSALWLGARCTAEVLSSLGLHLRGGSHSGGGTARVARAECTIAVQCSRKGILLTTAPVTVEVLDLSREKDPGAGSNQVGDEGSKAQIGQLFGVCLEPLTPGPICEGRFVVVMLLRPDGGYRRSSLPYPGLCTRFQFYTCVRCRVLYFECTGLWTDVSRPPLSWPGAPPVPQARETQLCLSGSCVNRAPAAFLSFVYIDELALNRGNI